MMNASPGVQTSLPMEGSQVQMTVGNDEVANMKKRQRNILITAIVLVILLIAVIIGLAVGLAGNGSDGDSQSSLRNGANSDTSSPTTSPVAVTTPAPVTPMPTVPALSARDYLINNGISTAALLDDSSSPQGQALASLDGVGIPTDPTSFLGYKYMERFVLSVLYYSTGGPDWDYQSRFLFRTIDTCSWNGSAFDQRVGAYRNGAFCSSADGNRTPVRAIWIRAFNVVLVMSFFALTSLFVQAVFR